jgi:CheY-like chemotaxis protein
MNQLTPAENLAPDFENPGVNVPQTPARSGSDDFRTELSHKLRTPLNSIIGFAELIALRSGNGAKDPDVHHILTAARGLLDIINRELADPKFPPPKNEPSLLPPIACDILYIEDDLVNFTLVERILELRPALRLLHAPRGQIGIELAQIHRPKLILLDLNLPDMHGSEVMRRLKEDPTTNSSPVVVLSADATPSQIERLLTAGARNYLTKPFDLDPFLAVIDDMIGEACKSVS